MDINKTNQPDAVALLLGAETPSMPEPAEYCCKRLTTAYGQNFICKLRPLTRREAEAAKLASDPDIAVVLKGMMEPNLADSRVIEHVCGNATAFTAEDVLLRLFQPGEIESMSRIIQNLSGYLATTFTAVKKN